MERSQRFPVKITAAPVNLADVRGEIAIRREARQEGTAFEADDNPQHGIGELDTGARSLALQCLRRTAITCRRILGTKVPGVPYLVGKWRRERVTVGGTGLRYRDALPSGRS